MTVLPSGAALLRRRPQSRDLPIVALLVLAFVLSAFWAFSTPLPVGADNPRWGNFHPDEGSHMAVIEYTASGQGLPPYRSPYDTSVHPPLYHAVVAAIPDALARPILGERGALRLVRLLSALMGVGVVWYTYVAGRAFAGRRAGLFAAALVLLVPMRVSLAGGLTNENLAALGAAGACAALAVGLRGQRRRRGRAGFDRRTLLSLALWTAVGIGSKVTNLGLLPAAAVALGWPVLARRRGASLARAASAQFALVLGVTLLVTGWWFARNVVLYGDPFRAAAANRIWDPVQPGAAVIIARKHWAAWRYALSIYGSGYLSFWGQFDGMSRRMPWAVYATLLAFQTVTLAGVLRWAARHRRRLRARLPLLLSWAVFAAWSLLVYTQYNWRHYTPQGRYFFVLLVPFGVLSAVGWRAALPWPLVRRIASVALLAFLFVVNLWALYVMPRRIGVPTVRAAAVAALEARHDTLILARNRAVERLR